MGTEVQGSLVASLGDLTVSVRQVVRGQPRASVPSAPLPHARPHGSRGTPPLGSRGGHRASVRSACPGGLITRLRQPSRVRCVTPPPREPLRSARPAWGEAALFPGRSSGLSLGERDAGQMPQCNAAGSAPLVMWFFIVWGLIVLWAQPADCESGRRARPLVGAGGPDSHAGQEAASGRDRDAVSGLSAG